MAKESGHLKWDYCSNESQCSCSYSKGHYSNSGWSNHRSPHCSNCLRGSRRAFDL